MKNYCQPQQDNKYVIWRKPALTDKNISVLRPIRSRCLIPPNKEAFIPQYFILIFVLSQTSSRTAVAEANSILYMFFIRWKVSLLGLGQMHYYFYFFYFAFVVIKWSEFLRTTFINWEKATKFNINFSCVSLRQQPLEVVFMVVMETKCVPVVLDTFYWPPGIVYILFSSGNFHLLLFQVQGSIYTYCWLQCSSYRNNANIEVCSMKLINAFILQWARPGWAAFCFHKVTKQQHI